MPMTKTFTENDLVRFLYGELKQKEIAELQHALVSNLALQEELNNLREVMDRLDGVTYQPSKRCLDNILGFSKGYEVHPA
ncbi:MAG: hypothetical protein ACJA08_000371 [Cyclobacteriaceae bacterium]|jgi:hypothetical protein